MTWGIVKKKETLGPPISLLLKDVDGVVDLLKEMVSTEIAITIFACLEYDPSFPVCVWISKVGERAEERKDALVSVREAPPLDG